MTHGVFQMAQIMPITTQTKIPTSPPLLWPRPPRQQLPVPSKLRRRVRALARRFRASYAPAPPVDDGRRWTVHSMKVLERCYQAPCSWSGSGELGPVMKGQYGALGAVTLEKSKLDLSQKQAKSSPEVRNRSRICLRGINLNIDLGNGSQFFCFVHLTR